MTPYQYVHNNPVNLIDPSGMEADGWRRNLKTGEMSYDSSFTDANTDASKYEYSDVGIDDNYIYDSDGSIKARENRGNSSTSNWYDFMYSENVYNFLYNNSAVTGYGSGEYGPWVPDAFGVSFNASAWGSSVGFSMVLDNHDNFDWFVSYSGGAGYTGAGFSVGGTFDLYNNSDPTKTVLNGIPGSTYDFSAGYGLMGGYSTPFDPKSRQVIGSGVDKYSFGMGTGFRVGEGRTYSSGEIYQMITNYFNSFNR